MYLKDKVLSPDQGLALVRGFFILVVGLLLTFSAKALTLEEVLAKAHEKNLSSTLQWKALLHYKQSLWGLKSQADGLEFFLAKDGKTNPQAELDAYLISLFNEKVEGGSDWHPYCRFPARARFFEKELGTSLNFFKLNCSKFDEFEKKLSAQAVSLVFSSYFINTPASTFGHTLLRFKRKGESGIESNELLDHAANYAASVTTKNSLVYAILGLTGGFRGDYAVLPYFYKIREYNDYESRDLWDYELNLTPDEIKMVVAHLWEMSSTYFDYFYLTENCSYHILGLLDAAHPEWRLQDRNPYIVIPVDTVKVVTETPGLLKKVSFRPSTRQKFAYQVNKMSIEERKALLQVLKKRNVTDVNKNLTIEGKTRVLDAAIDYLDFKYAKEILIENNPNMELKNSLLEERSKLGASVSMPTLKMNEKDSPHLGHGSRRIGFGAGEASNTGRFEQVSYRFSLHDLWDAPLGHNRHSTLEMGSFSLRYNEKVKYEGGKSKLWAEDLTLMNVVSLSPWDKFFRDFSWRAYFGAKTIRQKNYQNFLAPSPSLAGGISQSFRHWSYYLMAGSEFIFHSKIAHQGYEVALGPEAAIFYNLSDRLITGLRGQWQYRIVGDDHEYYRFGAESRFFFNRSWAFDVNYDLLPRDYEIMGRFYFYY